MIADNFAHGNCHPLGESATHLVEPRWSALGCAAGVSCSRELESAAPPCLNSVSITAHSVVSSCHF